MGSSWTRARTRVPCIGRKILNHCTIRETLGANFCKVFSTIGWDSIGRIITSNHTLFVFSIYSLNLQHFASALPEHFMDPSNLRFLRAEFLNLNTADILSRIILAVGVCAQHPWPLSTRCQYNSPQVVTTKNVSRHDQIFPGKKNHPPPNPAL